MRVSVIFASGILFFLLIASIDNQSFVRCDSDSDDDDNDNDNDDYDDDDDDDDDDDNDDDNEGTDKADSRRRVKVVDIKVLSLSTADTTATRRGMPRAQLECTGNYYRCKSYAPARVRCRNNGFNGVDDFEWSCESASGPLNKLVRFGGDLRVDCEPWYDPAERPHDPHVLAGSCRLRYSLEPAATVPGANMKPNLSSQTYKTYEYYNKDLYETSKLSNFLTLVIMIVIVSAIYKSCNKHREQAAAAVRRDINGTFAQIVDGQTGGPHGPHGAGTNIIVTDGSQRNQAGPNLGYLGGNAAMPSSPTSAATTGLLPCALLSNERGTFPPPPPPYGFVVSGGAQQQMAGVVKPEQEERNTSTNTTTTTTTTHITSAPAVVVDSAIANNNSPTVAQPISLTPVQAPAPEEDSNSSSSRTNNTNNTNNTNSNHSSTQVLLGTGTIGEISSHLLADNTNNTTSDRPEAPNTRQENTATSTSTSRATTATSTSPRTRRSESPPPAYEADFSA